MSMRSGNMSSPRNTVYTPTSETSSSTDGGIIEIASDGDIVLTIEHGTTVSKAIHTFRVNSQMLKAASKYFHGLLQPGRFREASDIEEKHKALRELYGTPSKAPSTELPTITIKDLGRISAVKAVDALMTDFLHIIHSKEVQASPPVANLANLAIVADRFFALDTVKSYVNRKKFVRALDGKTTSKQDAALTEEKVRQRLLVAILLDYPGWLEKYSARLIIKGWVAHEADESGALWWDLPSRVEEELAVRRAYALETIESIQSHFLNLYTSRTRQCKLGYDNSGQCDSFQLGEMLRFFVARTQTLQFQGTIASASPDDNDADAQAPPYTGDLTALLETLRQVPEYQIDRFHTHCGIRTRLIPLLELLQACLPLLAICPRCWGEDRGGSMWVSAKRPLLWKRSEHGVSLRFQRSRACVEWHEDVKGMFMARERVWD